MAKISVSILNLDFSELGNSIKNIENMGVDSFHMDIMDGHFVDNISFGPDIVKTVRALTLLPLNSHLMVSNPEKFVDRFFEAGSDSVIVHAEILTETNNYILNREHMGISLNPDIPLEEVYPYLEKVDRVLVMSVMAGFGGQQFIPESIDRISRLAQMRRKLELDFIISVDGGINSENAGQCVRAGADELAVGSYVTRADNPKEKIEFLKCLQT